MRIGLSICPLAAIVQVVGLTTFEHRFTRICPLLRLSHLAGHHSGHFRFDPEARSVGISFGDETVGMKLYVGNLSYDTNNASLEELFVPFGSVRSAQVIQDRDTGRSKGFGFVEMADDNAARTAMAELNEKDFGGRPLTVNEAKPREERSFGGGGGARRGNFNRR